MDWIMKRTIDIGIYLLFCVLISSILCSALSAEDGISDRLRKVMDSADRDKPIKVWVYFRDKDTSPDNFHKAVSLFTPRALDRRANTPLDWYDLPVKNEYVNGVVSIGGINVRASRWLNAVSARLTPDQIAKLAAEDFVKQIDPVTRAYRRPQPKLLPPGLIPDIDSAAYGRSYIQNHMLGIDSLHRLGLNGNGVILAFFDTGYLIYHLAFDSINILHTWDFINGDPNVDDEMAIGQTNHGTATLSACGGYETDSLIGPAYSADYVLAKTEILDQEIQIEEDNWIMAAEWADSLGADIISSSLGYSDWYTYADMDGNTAVTTVAADLAASRGMLVVISAGNEGDNPWHFIQAPADADSVVTVGAVTSNETIANYSSFGPSHDGRLKPEVVAMGSGVRCANDNGGYYFKSGTSLSAPMISGGAALILEANPSLRGNPMEIRRRLIESSDRYINPDNQYGYGLPDLVLAAGFGLRLLPIPMITIKSGVDTLVIFSTLGPVGESVSLDAIEIPDASIFTDNGDGTASLWYQGEISLAGTRQYIVAASAGEFVDTLEFIINTIVSSDVITVGPNPCTDSLRIFVNEIFPDGYKIEIFNLNGELVYRAFGQESVITWPAANQYGEKVASGVYIIRFSADGIERKVKIFKI
jgi:hypothetical protein